MTPATRSGRDLLAELSEVLRLPPRKLNKGVNFYLRDFSAYGNEVYEELPTRAAHWISFHEQGWFQRRLDRAFLAMQHADVVVDLGFSVPYPYTNATIRNSSTRFVFADRHHSALDFYDRIVRKNRWEKRLALDTTLLADIESAGCCNDVIAAVRALAPKRLLIIASEVLEHLQNDAHAWKLIRNLESLASVERCETFVTLPVGKRIPSHILQFRSSHAAEDYLASHMSQYQSYVLQSGGTEAKSPYLKACLCAFGRATRGLGLSFAWIPDSGRETALNASDWKAQRINRGNQRTRHRIRVRPRARDKHRG